MDPKKTSKGRKRKAAPNLGGDKNKSTPNKKIGGKPIISNINNHTTPESNSDASAKNSNLQVYVLPPDALKKYGINLEALQMNQFVENNSNDNLESINESTISSKNKASKSLQIKSALKLKIEEKNKKSLDLSANKNEYPIDDINKYSNINSSPTIRFPPFTLNNDDFNVENSTMNSFYPDLNKSDAVDQDCSNSITYPSAKSSPNIQIASIIKSSLLLSPNEGYGLNDIAECSSFENNFNDTSVTYDSNLSTDILNQTQKKKDTFQISLADDTSESLTIDDINEASCSDKLTSEEQTASLNLPEINSETSMSAGLSVINKSDNNISSTMIESPLLNENKESSIISVTDELIATKENNIRSSADHMLCDEHSISIVKTSLCTDDEISHTTESKIMNNETDKSSHVDQLVSTVKPLTLPPEMPISNCKLSLDTSNSVTFHPSLNANEENGIQINEPNHQSESNAYSADVLFCGKKNVLVIEPSLSEDSCDLPPLKICSDTSSVSSEGDTNQLPMTDMPCVKSDNLSIESLSCKNNDNVDLLLSKEKNHNIDKVSIEGNDDVPTSVEESQPVTPIKKVIQTLNTEANELILSEEINKINVIINTIPSMNEININSDQSQINIKDSLLSDDSFNDFVSRKSNVIDENKNICDENESVTKKKENTSDAESLGIINEERIDLVLQTDKNNLIKCNNIAIDENCIDSIHNKEEKLPKIDNSANNMQQIILSDIVDDIMIQEKVQLDLPILDVSAISNEPEIPLPIVNTIPTTSDSDNSTISNILPDEIDNSMEIVSEIVIDNLSFSPFKGCMLDSLSFLESPKKVLTESLLCHPCETEVSQLEYLSPESDLRECSSQKTDDNNVKKVTTNESIDSYLDKSESSSKNVETNINEPEDMSTEENEPLQNTKPDLKIDDSTKKIAELLKAFLSKNSKKMFGVEEPGGFSKKNVIKSKERNLYTIDSSYRIKWKKNKKDWKIIPKNNFENDECWSDIDDKNTNNGTWCSKKYIPCPKKNIKREFGFTSGEKYIIDKISHDEKLEPKCVDYKIDFRENFILENFSLDMPNYTIKEEPIFENDYIDSSLTTNDHISDYINEFTLNNRDERIVNILGNSHDAENFDKSEEYEASNAKRNALNEDIQIDVYKINNISIECGKSINAQRLDCFVNETVQTENNVEFKIEDENSMETSEIETDISENIQSNVINKVSVEDIENNLNKELSDRYDNTIELQEKTITLNKNNEVDVHLCEVIQDEVNTLSEIFQNNLYNELRIPPHKTGGNLFKGIQSNNNNDVCLEHRETVKTLTENIQIEVDNEFTMPQKTGDNSSEGVQSNNDVCLEYQETVDNPTENVQIEVNNELSVHQNKGDTSREDIQSNNINDLRIETTKAGRSCSPLGICVNNESSVLIQETGGTVCEDSQNSVNGELNMKNKSIENCIFPNACNKNDTINSEVNQTKDLEISLDTQLSQEKSENDFNNEIVKETKYLPKKRGRPKKVKILSDNSISRLPILKEKDNFGTDININNNAQILVNDKSTFHDNIDSLPVVPKKRGRPKKNLEHIKEIANEPTLNGIQESKEIDGIVNGSIPTLDPTLINEDDNGKHEQNDEELIPINNTIFKRGRQKKKDREKSCLSEKRSQKIDLTESINNKVEDARNHDTTSDEMSNLADLNKSPPVIDKKKKNKANTIMCICGVCSKEMAMKQWDKHNMEIHNLLAWMKGEDPIDMNDEKLVFNLLQRKVKAKKKLICEKCSATRSSSQGFICHINTCQKSAQEIDALKIKCPTCKKFIMPQSYRSHLNAHNDKIIRATSTDVKNNTIQNDTPIMRGKRKAAEEARESFKKLKLDLDGPCADEKIIIKQLFKLQNQKISRKLVDIWRKQENESEALYCVHPGCKHSERTVHDIKKHHYTCTSTLPKIFKCLVCEFKCEKRIDIISHVTKIHHHEILTSKKEDFSPTSDNSSSESEGCDEDYEDDSAKPYKKEKEKRHKVTKSTEKVVVNRFIFDKDASRTRTFYSQTGQEFAERNFSTETLFKDIICNNYEPLKVSDIEKYLPENRQSLKMSHEYYGKESIDSKEINWKQYRLFESELVNGALTFWCGGPVWSIAWCPGEREERYLAVAAERSMDTRYFADEYYEHENILQIWDVGKLSNEKCKCTENAKMVYGIAHNFGVIWDMCWCPSGCDDDCKIIFEKFNISSSEKDSEEKKRLSYLRMGLLAVASSNGNVYVYSVCHPSSLIARKSKIYHTNPSIVLQLQKNRSIKMGESASQATKLYWSQEKGHNIIAVGYSSGLVALFDLNNKSPLLRSISSEIIVLLPYFTFQAYPTAITGLILIPRFGNMENDIVAASSLIGCGIWVGNKNISNKVGHFSDIALAYPWPQILSICEEFSRDVITHKNFYGLYANSARSGVHDVGITTCGLFPGGGICDTNIWNNAIVAANTSGDVIVAPMISTLFNKHRRQKQHHKRIAVLSMCRVVNLTGESTSIDPVVGASVRQRFPNRTTDALIPETKLYKESIDRYGLLFIDVPYVRDKEYDLAKYKSQECPVDRWPLRNMLTIKAHPSPHTHWFQAYGGRSGQVRVICTTHLSNPNYTRKFQSNKESFF